MVLYYGFTPRFNSWNMISGIMFHKYRNIVARMWWWSIYNGITGILCKGYFMGLTAHMKLHGWFGMDALVWTSHTGEYRVVQRSYMKCICQVACFNEMRNRKMERSLVVIGLFCVGVCTFQRQAATVTNIPGDRQYQCDNDKTLLWGSRLPPTSRRHAHACRSRRAAPLAPRRIFWSWIWTRYWYVYLSYMDTSLNFSLR